MPALARPAVASAKDRSRQAEHTGLSRVSTRQTQELRELAREPLRVGYFEGRLTYAVTGWPALHQPSQTRGLRLTCSLGRPVPSPTHPKEECSMKPTFIAVLLLSLVTLAPAHAADQPAMAAAQPPAAR